MHLYFTLAFSGMSEILTYKFKSKSEETVSSRSNPKLQYSTAILVLLAAQLSKYVKINRTSKYPAPLGSNRQFPEVIKTLASTEAVSSKCSNLLEFLLLQ